MTKAQALVQQQEDCRVCRTLITFLTLPLFALMAAGAIITF
jgi:hypothetical protein